MLAIWLVAIIVFLQLLYSKVTSLWVKNPLPGPKGWPIIGCLFEIEPNRLHFSFDRWANKFGPLMLCRTPTANMVVISCPRMAKKAFTDKSYSNVLNDRPDIFFAKYIMDNAKGVIFSKYGESWSHLRKIMYKGLAMYGDGVHRFETLAAKELERLRQSIIDQVDRDFDPTETLSRSVANVIVILLTGSMVDESDSELIWKYNNSVNDTVIVTTEVMLTMFPFLRFMPVETGRRYRRTIDAKKKLLGKFFILQKETYTPGLERGLVDVLFKLQEQENRNGGKKWLTDSQIKAFIQDVIFAGIITTRNGILCILLVLLRHHECIDGIYEEIVKVVGLDRYPSVQDRSSMPYTEAVILEALRYITHAPIGVPHCATKDVEFEGYTIPKHATILINIWTIHHDPAIWGDPWTFRPERFLDENGELLPAEHTLRQSVMTFGSGKRNCIGENMARSRFFLFVTTLIQKFDLLPPEVGTLPSDDPRTFIPGASLRPQYFKMRANPR
ncbi:hypothetical protein ACJMK2_038507 [Sinanodonta woodiana]|uniref:Cytochrome P450 n=1 Tax=Sinanodonta woodiana TaxID=1069815 RepID=A0ABD3W960_SINWO